MPEIIENSSKIEDNSLNLVFRFIESFFKISSSAKMSFNTTSQDTCSQMMLLINLFYFYTATDQSAITLQL